jgi:hypothetical protein
VSLAAPTPHLHSPIGVLDQVARVSLDAPSPSRAEAIPCKSGLEAAFPAPLSPYLQCSTYRSSYRELSLGGSTGSQGPWLSHLRPTTKGGPLR